MSKIKMMANLPVYVDNIPIYSPNLLSIAQIEQELYGVYIYYCTLSTKEIDGEVKKGACDYDVLLSMLQEHDSHLYYFVQALYYFTKVEFNINYSVTNKDIIFTNSDNSIELNRKNYSSFIKKIKYVTCIENEEVEEMDEFDKLLAEREKKVLDAQNKNLERPTLEDLISAVANMDGNGLSILSVWNLNIYQFYEQLKRGQLKEQYRLTIQQLLAGAKAEELEIKSYLSNIE